MLEVLLRDVFEFQMVDGRIEQGASFEMFLTSLERGQPSSYPIFFEVNPKIDKTIDPATNKQHCSGDFFVQQGNTEAANDMVNRDAGFFNWIVENERIVYPGGATQFTGLGQSTQEIIRFRDDTDPNAQDECLRGSVAQLDYYDLRAAFGPGPYELTATFSIDPYHFQVCLTGVVPAMCLEPVERCEQFATEDTLRGTSRNDRLVANQSVQSNLFGQNGDDVLVARSQFDQIYGQGGDDILYAYTGSQTVIGRVIPGAGSDLYQNISLW